MKEGKLKTRNSGITLIALVITIIVLLILAGVTMATLIGDNGILTKAVKAKGKTAIATLEEKIKLILLDWESDKRLDPTVTEADFWEKLIREGIINDKEDISELEIDGDTKIYTIDTSDGYVVEIIVTPNGITIGDIENGKDLPLKIRSISVTEESSESISVETKVRGAKNVILSYYYKEKDETEYKQLEGKQDTTELRVTFTELKEGTIYNIKVVAQEDGETVESVKEVSTAIEGTITAHEPIWDETTHKASIELETITEYQIQWKKGATSGEWTTVEKGNKSTTVSGLEHNDVIYARLWNGIKAGKKAEVEVIDGQAPTATVTLNTALVASGGKVKATVTHTDNQSGVKISECKWKFTTSSDRLGVVTSSYSGDASGTFSSENQNIECSINVPGTYWLHVLTIDNAENVTETVSEDYLEVREPVARIGEDKYATLQSAIDDVPNDNSETTITVLKDIFENVSISKNKNVLLDLTDKTIKNETNNPVITINGALSVKNGTITAGSSNAISNYGTVEVSGTVEITNEGTTDKSTATIINQNGATLIVKGGTINSEKSRGLNNQSGGTLIVKGGTINAESSHAINNYGQAEISGTAKITSSTWNIGTLTITGGAINTEENPSLMNQTGGTVYIKGGTIHSSLANAFNNAGMAEISGTAVLTNDGSLRAGSWYPTVGNIEGGTLFVRGGTIYSENHNAIWNKNGGTLTVTGGTITAAKSNKYGIHNEGTATVTGGTISSKSGC